MDLIPESLELFFAIKEVNPKRPMQEISMITQVLINLLKNSIQALGEIPSGMISIKAFKEKGEVIMHISDNGHGIDEATMDDVFIPFFTTREKGSGIGLSYSREVMLLHGGRISVTSIPGVQTIFELSLPIEE